MHPCCWHNLLQTLAQVIPAFALFGLAFKKAITAAGLFWKLPAKKSSLLNHSATLATSPELKPSGNCSCEQETAR
jgi:hypothetical protein